MKIFFILRVMNNIQERSVEDIDMRKWIAYIGNCGI